MEKVILVIDQKHDTAIIFYSSKTQKRAVTIWFYSNRISKSNSWIEIIADFMGKYELINNFVKLCGLCKWQILLNLPAWKKIRKNIIKNNITV